MDMFTGLIEEIGTIKSFEKTGNGAYLTITSKTIATDVKIGDSIAINGICSTVTKKDNNSFSVEFSNQTLDITNSNGLKENSIVNLERALKLSDRLNGHLVSGHIDGIAKLEKVSNEGFSHKYTFSTTQEMQKYIINKGSIAINGISLTISELSLDNFSVTIIPHTIKKTNLQYLNCGETVNIETDMLGKYVEKLLSSNNNEKANTIINEQFLYEKGFL